MIKSINAISEENAYLSCGASSEWCSAMSKFDVVEKEDISLLVWDSKLESSMAFKNVLFFLIGEFLTVTPEGAIWSFLVRELVELLEFVPVMTATGDNLVELVDLTSVWAIFDLSTGLADHLEEVILEPFVLVSRHVIKHLFHLFLSLDTILSLPGAVPLWLPSILEGLLVLQIEQIVYSISLNLILEVLWESLRHFDIIHEESNSTCWSILEAAERYSRWEIVMVAHLVVEGDGDVGWLSGTDVEDAGSKVSSWVGASLVVVSDLDEVLSPFVEVECSFDSGIFKDDVTMFF